MSADYWVKQPKPANGGVKPQPARPAPEVSGGLRSLAKKAIQIDRPSASQPKLQSQPYKPTSSANDNLNQMTSSDSLYMQQARQSGLNSAARRGLLNSSIAAGASQGAAIQAAAPIAQADAQTQHQKEQTQAQIDYNKWSKGKDVQANIQGEYTNAINQLMSDYATNINQIETAAGLKQEEKDKMIMNAIARRDADMAFYKSLYSAMPVWQNNWTDFPTMPGAPGVTLPNKG